MTFISKEEIRELKPSRILVCGGRDFTDIYRGFCALNELSALFARQFCIIQGGAQGADYLSKLWARQRGTPCIQVDSNWEYFGLSAGTIRNQWMAQFCLPELTVAFPGGSGTADMIKQSQMRGIPVYAA